MPYRKGCMNDYACIYVNSVSGTSLGHLNNHWLYTILLELFLKLQCWTKNNSVIILYFKVMILITGAHKAFALYKAIEEGVNHMWTVSAFQQHPHTIFVCDEDATLELRVKTVKYFKGMWAFFCVPSSSHPDSKIEIIRAESGLHNSFEVMDSELLWNYFLLH